MAGDAPVAVKGRAMKSSIALKISLYVFRDGEGEVGR
jgi:hypothetical protein